VLTPSQTNGEVTRTNKAGIQTNKVVTPINKAVTQISRAVTQISKAVIGANNKGGQQLIHNQVLIWGNHSIQVDNHSM